MVAQGELARGVVLVRKRLQTGSQHREPTLSRRRSFFGVVGIAADWNLSKTEGRARPVNRVLGEVI